MEWIANQPVYFGDSTDRCSCGEGSYPQLSDNTDTIQFQFTINNCGAGQLLQDFNEYPYNDWVLSDGWSISDEMLCHAGENTTSSRLPISESDFPYGYYQVSITVESFGGVGALDVQIGNIVDGITTIGQITGVGEWNFYAFITPATDPFFPNQLNLAPSVAGVEVCMSEISAYKILTDAIIAVYDSEGNYVTEISYVEDTERFKYSEDTLTVTLQWSDLNVPAANGCYYLCLLDPCENSGGQNYQADITNPDFLGNANGWTLEEEAVYNSNDVIIGSGNPGEFGFIVQNNVFSGYINQCVDVDVSSITGSLVVLFGDTTVATISTPGTHRVCGVPSGDLGITLSVGSNSQATVESVSPVAVDPDDYECNLQSNTFKLANYTNSCTLLINACNNENGLGFVFNSTNNFSPRLRLEAKLNGLKYPSERISNENSLGAKKVVYFNGRKAKNLSIDLQPEYIHDFLRLLSGFDNFYINNTRYFVEDDEYNVEENEAIDNVGKVKILVSTRTQNVKNTNCSGTENDCSLA